METPEQKILFILEEIDNAKELTASEEPTKIYLEDIEWQLANTDHERIFQKLESENIIKILKKPDYLETLYYEVSIEKDFEKYFLGYKSNNQQGVKSMSLEEYKEAERLATQAPRLKEEAKGKIREFYKLKKHIAQQKNYNTKILTEENDPKNQIFIDLNKTGIYRVYENTKLIYPIKGKRSLIVSNLKKGKKSGKLLASIYNYQKPNLSQLNNTIDEINTLFKKNLKLSQDLIIHLGVGGFMLNENDYKIKFIK